MSELLEGLRKMHKEESHVIRGSRITIQIQLFNPRSKYFLKPYSMKTEPEEPISDEIIDENLKEIATVLNSISSLILIKEEHTVTTIDFDDDGRLSTIKNDFISGFKSIGLYQKNTSRILSQMIPQSMVELRIGPLGKTVDPATADFAGSIRIIDFRHPCDNETDKTIIEMNSYILKSYLPRIMKHGAGYQINIEEGSLGSPIELLPGRVFRS
ncbi:hypothetical protein [Brevibacillus reuszeri]|uniref:hypothetical protein n=1 Tax=Brevibacillus reuszeri TaxID=54915 RepID=UPI003D1B30CB